MCAANHRISKNSCQRPIITSHMKMSKILVRRAVISHRLTLEFIFTCQNANVNVQNEPLSIEVKEANPLMCVFCFVLFCLPYFPFILFSAWGCILLTQLYTLIPASKSTMPHLFSLCVYLCVCSC